MLRCLRYWILLILVSSTVGCAGYVKITGPLQSVDSLNEDATLGDAINKFGAPDEFFDLGGNQGDLYVWHQIESVGFLGIFTQRNKSDYVIIFNDLGIVHTKKQVPRIQAMSILGPLNIDVDDLDD